LYFCNKSIFFRKKTVNTETFLNLIIEVEEACKKCIVYVTLKLCICANILVTFVAVEECYTCSFGFRCFVLPYDSNHWYNVFVISVSALF
jgi:hypothetical protein